MKKLMTILIAFFVSVAISFAQAKPVVVIVPFDAKNVNKDDVDVISDVFLSEYTSTGKATVVDRSSFDKIKVQQKFEVSDWSSVDKVARLGKALNAHQIITGQISQFGSQLVCTVKLLDVNTTEIISSTVKRVANMDKLFEECSKLSQEIAAKASLSVSDYKIGAKGPGGGTVFAIEGDWRWEVSEVLQMNEDELVTCYEYISNDIFQDWDVPSLADAKLIYNNLVKGGHILASGLIYIDRGWSESRNYFWNDKRYFSLEEGKIYYSAWGETPVVRAVRKFNISDTGPKEDVVGNWQGSWKVLECFSGGSEFCSKIKSILSQKSGINEPMKFMLSIRKDRTFTMTFDYFTLDYIENWRRKDKKSDWKLDSCSVQNFMRWSPIVQGTWSKHRYANGAYRTRGEVWYEFHSDTGEQVLLSLLGQGSNGLSTCMVGTPDAVRLNENKIKSITNNENYNAERNQRVHESIWDIKFSISKF